ncbi:polysaccharide deacetylase family protein [Labrys wisconsinensis]|uniref:Polysaccharide deacetylase n=1 Tax=Labrys wisconsinensis TaxID=425677 RepID=A0ABU0J7D7_9HYPH|nr:polysaccharide deacetylase family protein [Labrys wisconsinensis]MDQ0469363.1 hypothetical protein [Labrys wisconsinensis]
MLGNACLFHRIDDIYRCYDELMGVLDQFVERGMHCLLAVIPGKLTPEMASYIRRNGNFSVFQHGVLHANRGTPARRDEFPADIARETMTAELQGGKLRLEDMLGSRVEGYVPPWNFTSGPALQVLEGLGFRYLSAGNAVLPTALRTLPARVDTLASYRPVRVAPVEHVEKHLRKEVAARGTAGLLYHVKDIPPDEMPWLGNVIRRAAPLTVPPGLWPVFLESRSAA